LCCALLKQHNSSHSGRYDIPGVKSKSTEKWHTERNKKKKTQEENNNYDDDD